MKDTTQTEKQFECLSASAHDFAQAKFCARHLLKNGWHSMPWERRGAIYSQQTAFVTNLIVAYARPFVQSKGWPAFPSRLKRFDQAQNEMHKRLLALRNEIFAHSDSQHFSFRPFDAGSFKSTLEQVPFAVLSADATARVETMTEYLLKATRQKLSELHTELLNPTA